MEVDSSSASASSKICSNCQTTTSIIWHRVTSKSSSNDGGNSETTTSKKNGVCYWCNFCQTKMRLLLAETIQPSSGSVKSDSDSNFNSTRKTTARSSPSSIEDLSNQSPSNSKPTTRTYASRHTPLTGATKLITNQNSRSKSRKRLRKNTHPEKSALQRATVVTDRLLWHNGTLFSVGDIVSVVDEIDNHGYYAQIRGLLKDQLCNKFAALTWMLPKVEANLKEPFCFKDYVFGPQDEHLYDLECLEFVCSPEIKTETLLLNDNMKLLSDDYSDDELIPAKQSAGI